MKPDIRNIPKARGAVIDLAFEALAAAEALAAGVPLFHNPPEKIRADLNRLKGDPDAEDGDTPSGTQSMFSLQCAAAVSATAAKNAAVAAGRAFCGTTIDVLKSSFGRRWNARWLVTGLGAGASRRSLAVPLDPVSMLIELGNYLRANPGMECLQLGVTAVEADAALEAINEARREAQAKRGARIRGKRERDEALAALRRRLKSLHMELQVLLTPDDERWYRFGFKRPSDRRRPEPVAELSLREIAPGEIAASWSRAPRAKNYRVSYRLVDDTDEPVEVGRFSDLQVVIANLPRGRRVIVSVSARNEIGESAALAAALAVS